MTAVKPANADRFLANPPAEIRAILLYGPDSGRVNERARQAAQGFLGPDADPFALIRLRGSDIQGDHGRIFDEVTSLTMFGGRRTVWISPEGANIAPSLAALKDDIPADVRIVVEEGALKPASPLRKLFEQNAVFAAISCYGDEARDLGALLDEELARDGLKIESDARALLLANLGGDRLASRMEIAKLCLYAHGNQTIAIEDVEAVIGDVSALELDRIADALALGGLGELDHTLQRLGDAGIPPARIVATALRHFLTLHALRCDVEAGTSARAAVDAMRPPVYFKRRDAMTRQLQAWPLGLIEQAIDRLHGAEKQARTGDRLAMAAVAQTLLHICAHAPGARRPAGV